MKKYLLLIISAGLFLHSQAQNRVELESGRPDAIVDLSTKSGTDLVQGKWKYSDASIISTPFHEAGPDRKPSGPVNSTHDIVPKAGMQNFDDSSWETLDPSSLDARRGSGKLSFNWYRFKFTVPDKIGSLSTAHSTVFFEIVVDDYAEVWVNGVLNKSIGQSGNSVISGFNSRNRILLSTDAYAGQIFQLAILGINGPLSDLPDNYIWIRSATLDFYSTFPHAPSYEAIANTVERLDPSLDEIISPETKMERLANGFQFTEGPVWNKDGFLLFSDPNTNAIYSLNNSGDVHVFRTKSGYTGTDIGEYSQPGSNGLAFDREGRLTICEHGNHRVTRLEKNGTLTVLADNYNGKRLNSPNDLVYRSDGTLYFTDPPYGLPKAFNDSRKELAFSGVYSIKDGKIKLLSTALNGPNGIVFSPDEKYLYVSNWDVTAIASTKIILRFEVNADGTLSNEKEFFNMNAEQGEIALDGLKADSKGNIYASGPGGVWIISEKGKLLGKIKGPELPANMAWGDADGKSLYLTARTGVYKIRLEVPGRLNP